VSAPPVVDEVVALQAALSELLGAERRMRGRLKGDLTISHVRALGWLEREGPDTPGQIARVTDLNPASVTGLLDGLERAGLIVRERGRQDRRLVLVSITDDGREVLARKREMWEACWREALRDLPAEQVDAACFVLRRLTALYDAVQRT
jgi:DNA-binding MarR family transcriptional regulator